MAQAKLQKISVISCYRSCFFLRCLLVNFHDLCHISIKKKKSYLTVLCYPDLSNVIQHCYTIYNVVGEVNADNKSVNICHKTFSKTNNLYQGMYKVPLLPQGSAGCVQISTLLYYIKFMGKNYKWERGRVSSGKGEEAISLLLLKIKLRTGIGNNS